MAARKYLLIIIWIILIISVLLLHGQTIKRPLIGHHDLANGLTLTVASIWEKEGIFTYFFAPVYSYTSDINLKEGFGIPGRDGRMYYVSFPPGVYIMFYLLAKLLSLGINDTSVRILSLTLFIITCFLLYSHLSARYGELATLVGVGAFSLFPISAYFLGSQFMYDVVILPYWFLSFLCFKKLVDKPNKLKYYVGFFLLIFILSFAGWIGLFLTASVFILVLLFGKRFSWSRKYRLIFLANLIGYSLLSLAITYLIFLSRIDQKILNNQLLYRFLYRTNTGLLTQSFLERADYFKRFYEKLIFHANIGFGKYFFIIFSGVLLILLLAIPFKIKLFKKNEILLYFFFFLLAPLFHYIFLSNHLYEHDFAYLLIYFFIVFIFVWSFKTVENLAERHAKKGAWSLSLLIALVYVTIIPLISINGYRTYFRDWKYYSTDYPKILIEMRKNTNPHDLVITNYDSNAMMWYYLQRNVLGLMVGKEVVKFKNTNPKIENVYYMSDVRSNTEISCGGRPIIYKDLLYICKLN